MVFFFCSFKECFGSFFDCLIPFISFSPSNCGEKGKKNKILLINMHNQIKLPHQLHLLFSILSPSSVRDEVGRVFQWSVLQLWLDNCIDQSSSIFKKLFFFALLLLYKLFPWFCSLHPAITYTSFPRILWSSSFCSFLKYNASALRSYAIVYPATSQLMYTQLVSSYLLCYNKKVCCKYIWHVNFSFLIFLGWCLGLTSDITGIKRHSTV